MQMQFVHRDHPFSSSALIHGWPYLGRVELWSIWCQSDFKLDNTQSSHTADDDHDIINEAINNNGDKLSLEKLKIAKSEQN